MCFVSTVLSVAQISSNAFYSEPTQYGGSDPEDPIFFYENINDASLSAPAGIAYQWYQYSTVSNSFEIIAGATSSNLDNIVENGYQVKVTASNGSYDEYSCWNFVPVIKVDSVGMPPKSATCFNLRVTAYTDNKQLTYYKHKSDNNALMVDYGYEWSSQPSGPIDGKTESTHLIDAPLEDTEYTVIVGEKFIARIEPGTRSKLYEAIAVEAKYSFETEGTADNEATEASAPMVVRFTDESLGKVNDWEWTFGDAGKDFVPDPIFTFQKFTEGGYPVILKVKNLDSECESETAPETFTVKNIVIKVPTAFTPFSTPTRNDKFKILYRSINKYTIVIYNRWGRKVYQSNNPADGWDGRIGNRRAEPGVYFYKIEATGFDKGEKENLEGAIHLIVN